jgi:protein MAK16
MSQHDEMIWQVINHQFCSYKSTLAKSKGPNRDARQFCKHPYSTTGVCNRSSCPLANSKYATIREENGRIHLYIKTVERAHSPKNLWEKIYLSRNYAKALGQLDEHLAYFPKAQVHRNKQRLTKIHQYLLRMRKLKLREINGSKASMTRVHRKVEQREERREKKALIAAKIENTIEKELVERLARGTYGDIYNFPEVPYQKALESLTEKESEEESEEELETEDEMSDEEEMEGMVEYVEDLDEEDEEDEEEEDDLEDMQMHGNAWDDESESEASEEDGSEEDDEDESSEGASDDESGSGSDGNSEEGDSSDEEDGKKPSKPSKKKTQPPPKKKEQPRRGVRVEIEYEDENDELVEKESATATAGGGAGLVW